VKAETFIRCLVVSSGLSLTQTSAQLNFWRKSVSQPRCSAIHHGTIVARVVVATASNWSGIGDTQFLKDL